MFKPFQLEFFVEYSAARDLYSFWCREGERALALPLQFEIQEEGQISEPFLTAHDPQKLMDAMWRAGIRPSHNHDVNPIIEAKNEHIEDLRRVAFDSQSST